MNEIKLYMMINICFICSFVLFVKIKCLQKPLNKSITLLLSLRVETKASVIHFNFFCFVFKQILGGFYATANSSSVDSYVKTVD